MACSESYAAKFGLKSSDTLRRSLDLLIDRGLLLIARRVQKLKRWPTLYGVTWWPLYYRDGERLDTPEPATHAYRDWHVTPTIGVNGEHGKKSRSLRPSELITPTIGVATSSHHSDSRPKMTSDHSDGRRNSENLGGSSEEVRITRLVQELPHLPNDDIALMLHVDVQHVADIRARLSLGDR